MVGGACAQSNLPSCQGHASSWSNCFDTYYFSNGDKYIGEWVSGKANGRGTQFIGDGQYKGGKYAGEFKDNKYDGFGTYYFPNGDKFVGEWKDGKRSGQGALTKADGRVGLGEWKDAKPHGRFIEFKPDKNIERAGIYENGKFIKADNVNPSIFNRISASINSQTESPVVVENYQLKAEEEKRKRNEIDDQLKITQQSFTNSSLKSNLSPCQGGDKSLWNDCFGVWVPKEGDKILSLNGVNTNGITYGPMRTTSQKYVGEWKNGMFHGFGSYDSGGGYKYTGEWKNGLKSGLGTQYSGGDFYFGFFDEDILDGQAVYFRQNGSFTLSEWRKGQLYGRFIDYKADKTIERSGIYETGLPVKLQKVDPYVFINLIKLKSELSFIDSEAGNQPQYFQQLIPAKITQKESKRIALVIGNASYNSAPLKNPLNDAADISSALRQSGFEVIDQRNATLQEMTRGIREFGDKLLKSDVGLVYYSGHGLEVKGRNYLLPVNASMIREDEIAFQAVDANLILEKMNTAKKSVNILIVDACRDNPFARSFRSVNRGLAQMDAPTGTIVSFSTAPGKTASDGDGRNSPFTKNLVKAMMRADMPIEAMFKEVRKSVVEETKGQQTPWESSSLIGDFYFKVSK